MCVRSDCNLPLKAITAAALHFTVKYNTQNVLLFISDIPNTLESETIALLLSHL